MIFTEEMTLYRRTDTVSATTGEVTTTYASSAVLKAAARPRLFRDQLDAAHETVGELTAYVEFNPDIEPPLPGDRIQWRETTYEVVTVPFPQFSFRRSRLSTRPHHLEVRMRVRTPQ